MFTLRFVMGSADLVWEEDAATKTDPHWAVVTFPATNRGATLVKSVAAESAGTVDLKVIDKLEAVRGVTFNLPVLTIPPCE